MMDSFYPTLVWFHVLLLTFWLGAGLGLFLLGQQFRQRHVYSLAERLTLLKLLALTDMGPRSAWALMVPSSLLLLRLGGWWPDMSDKIVWGGCIIGLLWLALVCYAHIHDRTPRAKVARSVENLLKLFLMAFYLTLGAVSLHHGGPLTGFIAWKAILFGLIFAAAIMTDLAFKPVGRHLIALVQQGSSDETEIPLRRAMDRMRIFVMIVYILLFAISWLGVSRGVPLL